MFTHFYYDRFVHVSMVSFAHYFMIWLCAGTLAFESKYPELGHRHLSVLSQELRFFFWYLTNFSEKQMFMLHKGFVSVSPTQGVWVQLKSSIIVTFFVLKDARNSHCHLCGKSLIYTSYKSWFCYQWLELQSVVILFLLDIFYLFIKFYSGLSLANSLYIYLFLLLIFRLKFRNLLQLLFGASTWILLIFVLCFVGGYRAVLNFLQGELLS